VILQAMAGGPFSHHGRYFNQQNIPISLAPVQRPHPPVWVGAMRTAAAIGSEIMPHLAGSQREGGIADHGEPTGPQDAPVPPRVPVWTKVESNAK
jgi:alkanesulfonate monooxygenase SsuD/methylene tetrahydromethanopterin reductase-like flavin-dependent oxidoreductase (luciferase family)